ncbi:MAG: hypothetical protein AMXMBFR7_22490 [Planctomycetota bacterium]
MPTPVRVPRNHGPRILTGYTLNGYELAYLENAKLRIAVNLSRGSHIPELVYKPRDLDLMFKPPQGHLHHTAFIPTAHDEKPYFDHHAGGWFECFPSGGPPVEYHGGRLGFHGELWGTPFAVERIEESADGCALTLVARTHRTPFEVRKTFKLTADEAELTITERVTNLGAVDLDVLWGQHPTFGAPFVDEHAYVEAPASKYLEAPDAQTFKPWPRGPLADGDLRRVRGQESRSGKMAYLTGLDEGRARLVSPSHGLAFELRWDATRFPYLWYYENAGQTGLPWFGRGYAVALEPFTGAGWSQAEGKPTLTIRAGASVEAAFVARCEDFPAARIP